MLEFLKRHFTIPARDPAADALRGIGFGQSVADDVRFLIQFRKFHKTQLTFREPSTEENTRIEAHPIINRFGDSTYAVAEWNGQLLIVRERMWFGWPDPPMYAFFALIGDTIDTAADFDWWPRRWTPPPTVNPADPLTEKAQA